MRAAGEEELEMVDLKGIKPQHQKPPGKQKGTADFVYHDLPGVSSVISVGDPTTEIEENH
jgi:hypothetical protein